jgi:hypothetical protein
MRHVHSAGTNVLKRLLIRASGFNLALLMRQLIGVGTPRGLHRRHLTVVATPWAWREPGRVCQVVEKCERVMNRL